VPSWNEPPRPAPLPPIDVEALAEQVIRSLDGRVVAARERLGMGRG
jgi:hypothetical protein